VQEVCGNKVELGTIEETEFYSTFATRKTGSPATLMPERANRSVRVRGLPFKISKSRVQSFFTDFVISTQEIDLVYENFDRNGGEAIVSLINVDERDRATRTMNNKQLLNRYVEVYPLI
jgi:RNA recognition motif-containing protein